MASPIGLTNASFEDNVLSCAGGPSCYTLTIDGWNSTGLVGTFKPGSIYSSIPDGVNVAALGAGDLATISQTTSAVVTANTTYTLTVYVGQRNDYPNTGYAVLLAGLVPVATDTGVPPAPGTFRKLTLTYDSGAAPSQLGEALTIRLSNAAGGQADFDAVALDVTPTASTSAVPEPATLLLTALGVGLVVIGKLRPIA